MKRIVLLIVAVVFSASISAQTTPSVKTEDVKNAETAVAVEQNPEDTEKQITEALMKDEGLQKETIAYLKGNSDTSDALNEIVGENKDSSSGIMEAVMGDSKLASAAIDWISNNPEMIQKAMKIIGM